MACVGGGGWCGGCRLLSVWGVVLGFGCRVGGGGGWRVVGGVGGFNGGLEELEILRALRAGTDPYSFGGGVC